MKQSEIKFTVGLDNQSIPETIIWEATDNPHGKPADTKAIALSIWDSEQKNTMRIDLWTKDMRVDDMKMFFVETLAGISDSIAKSTGDDKMAEEVKALVKNLITYLETEAKDSN